MKCSTGPTQLFPNVNQCERQMEVYIFGDPYCKECAKELGQLHALINGKPLDAETSRTTLPTV